MWEYTFMDVDPYALYHYGILGQKWGIRRYQNPDGTLTDAGKRRYWGGGSDYTNVGRKRYIKDLVKDYNKINGTNIDLRNAVVRVDGKYFTGKGVELDPKDMSVVRSQNKAQNKTEKKPYEAITSESDKRQIDEKPNSRMTKDELKIAREYYEQLNGYEEAGAKYAERHLSPKEKGARQRRAFLSDQGEKFAAGLLAAAGAAIGIWIKKKAEGTKQPGVDDELKALKVLKLRKELGE